MKESLFKQLFSLVRYLAKLEATTTAGRVNILGMLLSMILAISLSLAPLFETLVRLFRPGEDIGAPLLQIFVAFLFFHTSMHGDACVCRRGREAKVAFINFGK